MTTKKLSDNYIVISCNDDMWCAVVEKKDFRRWEIRFSYDGEYHHFWKKYDHTRLGALIIAKKFIKDNAKSA